MAKKITVLRAKTFFDYLINSKVYNIANKKNLLLYRRMSIIIRSILTRPTRSDHRDIYNPYER